VAISRRAIRKSLRTNFDPGPRFWFNRLKLRGQQLIHVPSLLTGGRVDRPIFVIGAPRAGTHMLYLILRSSSRLAHWRPSEAHEVWELDYHPALRGWESNALVASDVNPEAAARIRRSFLLVAGNGLRFIDKAPRNCLRLPFIDAIFPDARYVYLQRDGRENVNSLINAWRSPRYRTYELPQPHSIPGVDPRWWKFVLYPGWQEDTRGPLEVVCAKQWTVSNEYALEASKKIGLDRWIEVRYEELVDDPVEQVARLMEFLGLPYEREVRDRAAASKTTPVNTVTPPERGKWRRENPEEIAAVRPLIEHTMNTLGYELDGDEI
jgi:hypothetical protein